MVPVSVATKVGTTPETALLLASFKVTVIVEVAEPSATTGVVPVIVEFAATAAPDVKFTIDPVTPTGEVSCRVFASALVDIKVQREDPEESELEQAP